MTVRLGSDASLNVRDGSIRVDLIGRADVRFTPITTRKRTSRDVRGMPIAAARKCQKRNYAAQQKATLFDHFVSEEQEAIGDPEAEALRSPQIDYQLEPARPFYR